MGEHDLVEILEGALLAAGEPLSKKQLAQLFDELERPSTADITAALETVAERCEGRGFELAEVASGFRFQVRQHLSPWVSKLWVERPVRYSRALLETLSLIAYRQPITRGEIEDIRGVAVSSNIMKSLLEREWVKVVPCIGQKSWDVQFFQRIAASAIRNWPLVAHLLPKRKFSAPIIISSPTEAFMIRLLRANTNDSHYKDCKPSSLRIMLLLL